MLLDFGHYPEYANPLILDLYGFVLEDNKYRLPSFISYELNKEDPLYEAKSKIVGPKIEMAFNISGPKER